MYTGVSEESNIYIEKKSLIVCHYVNSITASYFHIKKILSSVKSFAKKTFHRTRMSKGKRGRMRKK